VVYFEEVKVVRGEGRRGEESEEGEKEQKIERDEKGKIGVQKVGQ
jgi:hypothetical protein